MGTAYHPQYGAEDEIDLNDLGPMEALDTLTGFDSALTDVCQSEKNLRNYLRLTN